MLEYKSSQIETVTKEKLLKLERDIGIFGRRLVNVQRIGSLHPHSSMLNVCAERMFRPARPRLFPLCSRNPYMYPSLVIKETAQLFLSI